MTTTFDLTTTARVATRLLANTGATTLGTNPDAALATLVTAVSAHVETALDRQVKSQAMTEYLDVLPGQSVWSLRAFPVSAFTSANFDTAQSFAAGNAFAATDYYDPTLDVCGRLRLRGGALTDDRSTLYPAALKVVYTGGMAASTAAFITAFPDIALAVEIQCAYLWLRRNDLGIGSLASDAGTLSPSSEIVPDFLIPVVRSMIAPYRREAHNA